MARYFLEVAYKGTHYSGFQVQENANTVQAEVEKAFKTIQRHGTQLTGSSRTDAGVHAIQNFFHFDFEEVIHPQIVYKMNAVLPNDIVVKNILLMPPQAHSRFDATSREYIYRIHKFKNPFLTTTSLYYPYKLNIEAMQEGAEYILGQNNFFSFSKTNTQVKNFNCTIFKSQWIQQEDELVFNIQANRFLRGMVRLITATLLKMGRGQISINELERLFQNREKCGFSLPPSGLYLKRVVYVGDYLSAPAERFTRF